MDGKITDKELDKARADFGQMLRRWRTSNNWSGKTPGQWYKAAPGTLNRQVASATWTGFELGRATAPAPETFLALERMNEALHTGEIGSIADRKLRQRIEAGRPILHANGEPWGAVDFFAAFIGRLAFPEHLRPAAFDGEKRAEDFRANLRRIGGRHGLPATTSLLQVLRLCTGATARDLATIEKVALNRDRFPDAVSAELAEGALEDWALSLEE